VGGDVTSLVLNGGNLYAGGNFARTRIGTECLSNVAVLVPQGSEWQDVGGGCDNLVMDMEWYQNSLYVTGLMRFCGNKIVNFIAAWDGSQWNALNEGLDDIGTALEIYNGELVVGGEFVAAGGIRTYGIASWNGQRWRSFVSPCSDLTCAIETSLFVDQPELTRPTTFSLQTVYALQQYNGVLYTVADIETETYDAAGTCLTTAATCEATRSQVFSSLLTAWDGSQWTIVVTDDFVSAPQHPIFMNGTILTFAGIDSATELSVNAFDVGRSNMVIPGFSTDSATFAQSSG